MAFNLAELEHTVDVVADRTGSVGERPRQICGRPDHRRARALVDAPRPPDA